MHIKRNIIFAPESRKKDGIPVTKNVPIRMRVIFASQRIEFTTGYRIDVEKWDTDKQRVRNGCTNKLKQSASEINAELLRQYTEIQNVFKEFEVQDVTPTPAQIKEAFNLKTKGEKKESHEEKQKVELDFMKVFNEFVAECSKQNDWSSSTLKKFATVKKHIYTFDPNTTFDSWTEKHFNDYIEFLRAEKNMRNTSIAKQIKFVKWFLRWSNRKGYHQNMAYDKFTPKMKSAPKKVIFLTQNEINKLRTCPIPPTKKYLERVRDVLLFCCFTGLRHSDVYNLKRSDVKNGHIEVITIKTTDSLIIELNDHSKAILEKYKDVPFPNDKALPVVSNQRMNEFLKELGQLAEIDEPIRETYYRGNERIDEVTPKYALLSTHTGRRTFICNALALGIPVQVVMKWTGHSDYKAMKPYIDIADEIKINAMWKIQCKLPPKTKRFCPLKTFNNAPLKSLDRWGYYYFSLFPSVCSHFTDTFSCQLNPVRRMYNTIHNGICYCRVSDCIIPIVRWQLRGDDDGLAPMSVLYYIEQDGSFLGIKVHKEEVIQYEQRAPFDSLEFRFQCAFYFCHLKRTHKFRSIRIICPYALLAGFIPHCCGKEALPGTG